MKPEVIRRHLRRERVDVVFLSAKLSPLVVVAAVLPHSSFSVFFVAARACHRSLPSSRSLVIMAAEGKEKPQETKQEEVTEEKTEEAPKESSEEEKEAPAEEKEGEETEGEKEAPAEEKEGEETEGEKEAPAEGEETASEEEEAPAEEEEAPAEEEEEEEEEEVVDPKAEIEDGCKPKCVRQLLAYQACERRIEEDEDGQKHCTGQYFDYWGCIDKCAAPKLFRKLK